MTPEECVKLTVELGVDSELVFQPLMGGMDPALAWKSLEMFEHQVLPHLQELALLPRAGAANAAGGW